VLDVLQAGILSRGHRTLRRKKKMMLAGVTMIVLSNTILLVNFLLFLLFPDRLVDQDQDHDQDFVLNVHTVGFNLDTILSAIGITMVSGAVEGAVEKWIKSGVGPPLSPSRSWINLLSRKKAVSR
jgi:hypothetical protein